MTKPDTAVKSPHCPHCGSDDITQNKTKRWNRRVQKWQSDKPVEMGCCYCYKLFKKSEIDWTHHNNT